MTAKKPLLPRATLLILTLAVATSSIETAAAQQPAPATDANIVRQLEDYMDKLAAEDRFSGAVLLAKDGKPIFKKAYGLASKRYNVPNQTDTKFNLGSMNKMFTGVAICQLAQQGKLAFDDPIIKHIPDYPNKEIAEKVTIHHLLTHTSGLGSYWNDKYEQRWTRIRTVQDFLDLFVDEPLDFEPGERFQYSNAGPIVLGLIIERITGETYYDYVRDHIYKPAAMINTDCYELDRPTPNLAIGYTHLGYDGVEEGGPRRNNLFLHSVKGGPAGGGFSTVEDLLRFANAIQNHTLLNEKYTDIMLDGKVSLGPRMKYAYLFGDENAGGHRAFGHNGGAPGINAVLTVVPDLGYTFAMMSNYDGVESRISRFMQKRFGEFPAQDSPDNEARNTDAGSDQPKYRMGAGLRAGDELIGVDYVEEGSPAERAGLQPDDELLTINGFPIDSDSLDVLRNALAKPDPIRIKVQRGEKTVELTLTPEKIE